MLEQVAPQDYVIGSSELHSIKELPGSIRLLISIGRTTLP